ncbi:hypothetical protein [uncultured Tateyamaria sp.]|uniref:hypothetical protein n=1 Tax=uncultured Tateyamaria sp. TaxID=455651 RepID=UPI00262F44D5|nr:hypothetical protein [uncultured Tateyamaria sp.]
MAIAEDSSGLFIFKKDGEMPQVEASSVDRLGASAVHDLLGEDYVVFHGARETLSATSPFPVQPIVIPDDDVPLPECQCPEDYRIGLAERFGAPEMQKRLGRERTILAPEAIPTLEVDQIRMLEQMIQQNGPLILQGQ